jgi:hypothetical protein
MKKLLPLLVLGLVVISCNNNANENKEAETDSTAVDEPRQMWAAQHDSTGRLELITIPANEAVDTTVPGVINYLNATFPEIKLVHVKTSNDTVYLHIDDASYLTQRMGSSGPVIYLATAVYNLTEMPSVRFVSFDFEEGDHASPGTFTRETFAND